MSIPAWLLWGFAATVVLTTLLSSSQGLGLTRMNVPFLLGSMLTPRRDRAKLYGFLMHLCIGWLFALTYLAAFHLLHRATWWLGVIIGLIHGAFVLTVGLPLLPGLHPRMAGAHGGSTIRRQIEPPGFLGLHYGIQTPVSVMVAHALFGAILGAFYPIG
jgi:hypothetical protein